MFAITLHSKGFHLAAPCLAGVNDDSFHHVFANQRDEGFVADGVVGRGEPIELHEAAPIVVSEQVVCILAPLIREHVHDVFLNCVLGRIVAADAEQDTKSKGNNEKEDQAKIDGTADEIDEFTHRFSPPNVLIRS